MRIKPALTIAAMLSFVSATAVPRPGAVDDRRILAASRTPADWLVNGGDLAGRHFSALDQINEANVAQLKPAWSVDLDTTRGQESEPIVVDGVMYVTTAWSKVYALDAASGALKWRYDPGVPGAVGARACCDVVNRGAAVYAGKVYVGTLDSRLIALDAGSGKPVWSVDTVAGLTGAYSITGAPRVFGGRVVVGNGGADLGARGFVSAYDAATGRKLWRFYTVPGAPGRVGGEASDAALDHIARPTWFGDQYWRIGGGGTAWNAIAYDPEFDRIYIGTGNGSPWNRKFRSEGKGDNLFLCSVIALDAKTGRYVWHYQENPGESWDYNGTQPFIQTELTIGGRRRKVLLHAPKNGFFYVLDRTDGKFISAGPLIEGISWASGFDAAGRPKQAPGLFYENAPFMLMPGPAGAHNWYPMALDPKTRLVFLPIREKGVVIRGRPGFNPEGEGVFNEGAELGPAAKGETLPVIPPSVDYLLAWDPVAQQPRWRVPGLGGGVLATGGGLVFQGRGEGTGELLALRATDGEILWRYHMPNAVLPGPITYSVRGEQYVATASGDGATRIYAALREYAPQPGRIVAFKLGGTARLPADPGPPRPFNPSSRQWSAGSVADGEKDYARYCARCHGAIAHSSNIVPDLRRSAMLQSAQAWRAIVIDGALTGRGMIGWKHVLTPERAEAVRGYVDDAAQKARATGGT